MLVLVSAHSNLLFQIFQCDLSGIFLVRWVGFLVGFSNSWVFIGGYNFLPGIGICISLIVMWLVLLVGVS